MNRLRLSRFRVIHVPVFYILVPHAATGWCQNSGSPSTTGEVLKLDRAVTLRCPLLVEYFIHVTPARWVKSQGGSDRLLRLLNAGWLNHVFGSFPDRTVACSSDGSLPEIQKASHF
jgi:hypothetical protein